MGEAENIIGNNIRTYRKERGWTQKQLAEKCGMYESQIRKYETGKATPKNQTLQKIATALDVHIYELDDSEIDSFIADLLSIARKNRENALSPTEALQNFLNFMHVPFPEDLNDSVVLESKLVFLYKQLNAKGQNKAVEQVEMLTKIPEYKKDYDHTAGPDAAYDRTNANVTEDMKMNDDIVDPDED